VPFQRSAVGILQTTLKRLQTISKRSDVVDIRKPRSEIGISWAGGGSVQKVKLDGGQKRVVSWKSVFPGQGVNLGKGRIWVEGKLMCMRLFISSFKWES